MLAWKPKSILLPGPTTHGLSKNLIFGLPAKKIAFNMLLSFDGPTVFVAPPAA
jgi:hypothetical protein